MTLKEWTVLLINILKLYILSPNSADPIAPLVGLGTSTACCNGESKRSPGRNEKNENNVILTWISWINKRCVEIKRTLNSLIRHWLDYSLFTSTHCILPHTPLELVKVHQPTSTLDSTKTNHITRLLCRDWKWRSTYLSTYHDLSINLSIYPCINQCVQYEHGMMESDVEWYSASASAALAVARVLPMRMDRMLDLSVKMWSRSFQNVQFPKLPWTR